MGHGPTVASTVYRARMLVDDARYVGGARCAHRERPATGDAGFEWVGLVDPSRDELAAWARRLGLDDLSVDDAMSGCQRPHLDLHDAHACLVLKTVAYDRGSRRITVGDLSVMWNDGLVLTIRHGDALPVRTIRAELESDPQRLRRGPTAVVLGLLRRLVEQYLDVAARLGEDVARLEDVVFDDEVPVTGNDLYIVKREIIEFRRAVQPLVEPLGRLVAGGGVRIGESDRARFADALNQLRRVVDEAESLNELLTAALQANLTLVQVKQNADMRRISAWVGIGAVPTMVAGIYCMNFDYMPELGWRYGYLLVVGGLGVVCMALFLLFRRYRWL